MRLARSVRLSIRALSAHRVRAALAVASVGAGVAAVVLTSAVGAGVERDIGRQIADLGVNLLVVRPVRTGTSAARRQVSGTVTTLRPEDDSAIAELPLVAASAPTIERPVRIKAGRYLTKTRLMGTTPEYFTVRRFALHSGRFLDADDEREARRVVVLGPRVARALFEGDPLGRQVRIGGVPFDVVGVTAPRGSLADGDDDNQVMVPLRTALRRVLNSPFLDGIFVSARDGGSLAETQAAIGAVLRDRHQIAADAEPDFEVQDAARFFALQRSATGRIGWLSSGLAGVALLVGGIGIMGLMLLSIRERRSEIGLRSAVGATPRDILVQFLLEATVLALAGWGAGLLLAAAGAGLVAAHTTWPMAMPLGAVLTSLAAALSIGLGFGSVPARQASLIPPVRALLAK